MCTQTHTQDKTTFQDWIDSHPIFMFVNVSISQVLHLFKNISIRAILDFFLPKPYASTNSMYVAALERSSCSSRLVFPLSRWIAHFIHFEAHNSWWIFLVYALLCPLFPLFVPPPPLSSLFTPSAPPFFSLSVPCCCFSAAVWIALTIQSINISSLLPQQSIRAAHTNRYVYSSNMSLCSPALRAPVCVCMQTSVWLHSIDSIQFLRFFRSSWWLPMCLHAFIPLSMFVYALRSYGHKTNNLAMRQFLLRHWIQIEGIGAHSHTRTSNIQAHSRKKWHLRKQNWQ